MLHTEEQNYRRLKLLRIAGYSFSAISVAAAAFTLYYKQDFGSAAMFVTAVCCAVMLIIVHRGLLESARFHYSGMAFHEAAQDTYKAIRKVMDDTDIVDMPERDDTTGGHYIV